jgi:hypothetical protein
MSRRRVSVVFAGLALAVVMPGGVAWAQQPDYYAGCPEGENTILGTNGNDVITGTPLRDLINSLAGNDVVDGQAASDCILLGAGRDRGQGNTGNDRIFGQGGRDLIRGAAGNDRLNGGSARDRLVGAAGRDRAVGGSGNDVLAFYRMLGIVQDAEIGVHFQNTNGRVEAVENAVWENLHPTNALDRRPVYMKIGNKLKYFGWVSNLEITYTHFTRTLIPTRCAVNVSMIIDADEEERRAREAAQSKSTTAEMNKVLAGAGLMQIDVGFDGATPNTAGPLPPEVDYGHLTSITPGL